MSTGDGNESSLIRVLTGLNDPRSLAGFLEIAFDAVITFDSQERITSWNPAAEKLFGWTAQEAVGKTSAELFWPVNTSQEREDKKQRQLRLAQGETLEGEFSPCRKDGSSVRVQFSARASFDSYGKLNGFLAVYHDISARVQALEKEKALEFSNQRLNEILGSIQDDFYVLNRDWVFVFVSRTFTSRIGKEPEDFVGNNIWEMFPKHVGGVLYQNFHAAMEKREIRRFEIPGRYTNARYSMAAFPSADGITVLGTDVTERRQAEEVLLRQAQLLNLSSEAIFVWEFDGGIEYWNHGAEKLYGYSREEVIGQVSHELLATYRPYSGISFITMLERDGEWRGELIHRTKDGRSVIVESKQQLIHQDGRKLVLETNRDITERKQIEEALRVESERFLQFVNSNIVGILIGDSNGKVILANDYYLNLLGVTRQDFMDGKVDWRKFTPPEWLSADEKAVQELRERGVCEPYEKEYVRADGTRIPVYIADAMLAGPGEEIAAFVLDITERKQAEDALRESEKELQLLNESLEQKVQEKTAEIRRLASDTTRAVQRERHRISHILHDDLQQRIYAIQMQLAFLRYELQTENENAQNELSSIEKQLSEVLEITRHLSIDLSPPILREEGLSHAISWLADQMRQRYGLPIEVLADEPFAISEEELHVFLFNCVRELLFNVVKHAEASRAVVQLHWQDSNLLIEVSDNGKGFPVGTEKQFTREMGTADALHTSFGLPTILQQLSLFGGRMEIKSKPGEGTQITLIAPVAKST